MGNVDAVELGVDHGDSGVRFLCIDWDTIGNEENVATSFCRRFVLLIVVVGFGVL